MAEAITPINIIGAAIVTQLSLMFIMLSGIVCFEHNLGSRVSDIASASKGLILFVTIISIGGLVFTKEFSTVWQPLFSYELSTLLTWSKAIHLMFIMDIICVSFLVLGTGGSRDSAFSSIYFILPALAIFLRESTAAIILYTVLVSIMFILNIDLAEAIFGVRIDTDEKEASSSAYLFVSLACLALATIIGYITRPK